ncbi:MAG: hypothetical protein N2B06_02400 [Clostridium sp.]
MSSHKRSRDVDKILKMERAQKRTRIVRKRIPIRTTGPCQRGEILTSTGCQPEKVRESIALQSSVAHLGRQLPNEVVQKITKYTTTQIHHATVEFWVSDIYDVYSYPIILRWSFEYPMSVTQMERRVLHELDTTIFDENSIIWKKYSDSLGPLMMEKYRGKSLLYILRNYVIESISQDYVQYFPDKTEYEMINDIYSRDFLDIYYDGWPEEQELPFVLMTPETSHEKSYRLAKEKFELEYNLAKKKMELSKREYRKWQGQPLLNIAIDARNLE